MAKPGCTALAGPGGRKTPTQSNSPEITMRPATYYYLARFWQPRRHHQAQPGAPSRARSRGRHAKVPGRGHPGRDLTALARRILGVLSGTSQPA